ncbi:hypothetical protein V8C37DRAFT_392326 [Trichoderma ceciliae]
MYGDTPYPPTTQHGVQVKPEIPISDPIHPKAAKGKKGFVPHPHPTDPFKGPRALRNRQPICLLRDARMPLDSGSNLTMPKPTKRQICNSPVCFLLPLGTLWYLFVPFRTCISSLGAHMPAFPHLTGSSLRQGLHNLKKTASGVQLIWTLMLFPSLPRIPRQPRSGSATHQHGSDIRLPHPRIEISKHSRYRSAVRELRAHTDRRPGCEKALEP